MNLLKTFILGSMPKIVCGAGYPSKLVLTSQINEVKGLIDFCEFLLNLKEKLVITT